MKDKYCLSIFTIYFNGCSVVSGKEVVIYAYSCSSNYQIYISDVIYKS